MNANIEVINEHLWALKFSLIPFIKEIEYNPYDEVLAYQEPIRLNRATGLILLNKDHKGYELVKDAILIAMGKKNKELEKRLIVFKKMGRKDNYQIILESAYRIEFERRISMEINNKINNSSQRRM